MAAISSNGTGGGNWSAAATWNGGVVPGEGDNATIVAGDTVTIDDSAAQPLVVGDDTGTALSISGILQYTASQSADHTLRLKGNMNVNNGGQFLVGTSGSPIVNTVFKIEVNYSASLAQDKYQIYVYSGGKFKAYGNALTYRKTALSSQASSGQADLVCDDSTGWVNGDRVCLLYRSNPGSQTFKSEAGLVSSVSANTVTLQANLANTHIVDTVVCNLQRNVIITSYDTSYQGKILFKESAVGDVVLSWVMFDQLYKVYLDGYSSRYCNVTFDYCAFYQSIIHYERFNNNWVVWTNCSIFNSGNGWGGASEGSTMKFVGCEFTQNSGDGRYQIFWFDGCEVANGTASYGSFREGNVYAKDSKFYGFYHASNRSIFYTSHWQFENCEFFNNQHPVDMGQGTRGGRILNCNFHDNSLADIGWESENVDCVLINTILGSTSQFSGQSSLSFRYRDMFPQKIQMLKSSNHGAVSGRHKTWQRYGTISDQISNGQTAAYAKGGSGICVALSPSDQAFPLVWEFYVPVTAATQFTLKMYLTKTTSGFDGSVKVTIFDSDDDLTKLLNQETISNASIPVNDGSGDDWTYQYQATPVTPTNTGFCRVLVEVLDGATTGDILIDDVTVA